VPAAPISWISAISSTSLAPADFADSTAITPCEWPANATGGVAEKSMPWRVSARMAAIWVSSMPGIEVAAEVSCFAVGTGSPAACARTHRIGSNPTGRTTTNSSAIGASSKSASPASVANSSSIPADDTNSSRLSSQPLPCPPNATA